VTDREVLDPDRFLDYEHGVVRSRLVDQVLGLVDREGVEICDVGGASGRFLDEIARRSEWPIRGTVFETVDDYRERLVSDSIQFKLGSIVDPEIEPESFDVVTARHVLHHLIGDSLEQTMSNQVTAIDHMVRMVRPGGHVVFEEEVNPIRPFARLVYALSKLANRYRLQSRTFEAGKVVVCFMTPDEIDRAVESAVGRYAAEIVHRDYRRREVDLKWKLTLLMSNVGDLLYVIRRPPDAD
jgi:2-polyprenyl-3-methyl-5-hydroxy-6-metoxy-1,4-benzoquinol methylase